MDEGRCENLRDFFKPDSENNAIVCGHAPVFGSGDADGAGV